MLVVLGDKNIDKWSVIRISRRTKMKKMRKESQNEITKRGLVMDERIRPKIGLRMSIFQVLKKKKRARVMGS